jgi:acetyltransferase EpsM
MNNSIQKLLILGTGTFAEEIADVASDIPWIQLSGFVENMNKKRCNETISELPVFWVDELSSMSASYKAISGLGTTHRSLFTAQAEKYNIQFITLIHPTVNISQKSKIDEGTFVSCGVIIAAQTHIGRHVVINRGALIGHHTTIGSFVTIGPGVNLGGNSIIGDNTYIGIGATIIDHISVGSHSVIAAGAAVTKDVPDNVLVAGIPAKIIKEDIDGK